MDNPKLSFPQWHLLNMLRTQELVLFHSRPFKGMTKWQYRYWLQHGDNPGKWEYTARICTGKTKTVNILMSYGFVKAEEDLYWDRKTKITVYQLTRAGQSYYRRRHES